MAEKKERTREKELAKVEKEKRLNKLKEEVLDHHNIVLEIEGHSRACRWSVRCWECYTHWQWNYLHSHLG